MDASDQHDRFANGSQVRSYFNGRAREYESGNWRRRGLFDEEQQLISRLPFGLAIGIDIGSGAGKVVPSLALHVRAVLAIDSSPAMLRLRTHGFSAVVADGLDLPLGDGSVDLTYMRMSMHYFELSMLRVELSRVMKPGGYLIVTSIFPYGPRDKAWFNERHRLKGKMNAYTPDIRELVKTLESTFELESSAVWRDTNLMSSSLKAHQAGNAEGLIRHALSAPNEIRGLYQIPEGPSSELTLTVRWASLKFRSR